MDCFIDVFSDPKIFAVGWIQKSFLNQKGSFKGLGSSRNDY